MSENKPDDTVDWSLTTWEGSRREELRRWAQLPLENIISALEEMQELAASMEIPAQSEQPLQPAIGNRVAEQDNN